MLAPTLGRGGCILPAPAARPRLSISLARCRTSWPVACKVAGLEDAPAWGLGQGPAGSGSAGGGQNEPGVAMKQAHSVAPDLPALSNQTHDLDFFERDELQESSRKYQRTLSSFTWDRWASHRSTWRFVRHMRGIFKSSIVRRLQQPLFYVGTLATLVCAYEQLLQDGVLPSALPSLQLASIPFELSSFALSLLLVFRTNTSYDRWSNACSLWGTVANVSRDTLRQVLSGSLRGGLASPLPAAMCRWVVAYVRALKAQLTEDSDLRAELQGTLQPAELDLLCASWHPPSFALAVLSELVGLAGLREVQCARLDEGLSALEDAVGACERILRTPIPLSYTRHTSRFLVIWLTALPLGLWPGCHWGTIPLSLVLAFLLLGIEEIGVQIEEPFGLLPLDDLCVEIEGDLYGMLREAGAAKSTAAGAAGGYAAGATGSASSGGSRDAKRAMERTASNLASNIASIKRKREGTSAKRDKAGAFQGPARWEWAEGGSRARNDTPASRSAADAIFSSLDDCDV